jgi:hypothetical protein
VAYLADTNVAPRRALPAGPPHPIIVSAIERVRRQGEIIYGTAQVLIELHALATRPVAANRRLLLILLVVA